MICIYRFFSRYANFLLFDPLITAPTTALDLVNMEYQGPRSDEILMISCLTAVRSAVFNSWFFTKTVLQIWQFRIETSAVIS